MINRLMTDGIDEMLSLSITIIGVKRPINSKVGSRNPIMVNRSTNKIEIINMAIAT